MLNNTKIASDSVFSTLMIICVLLTSCQNKVDDAAFLTGLHEQGRDLFYTTIIESIDNHPEKSRLTDSEIEKIGNLRNSHERLYELLVNVFYQKEEPEFSRLLTQSGEKSKTEFKEKYLRLVRSSAGHFVNSFFATDDATEWILNNMEKYEDMDTVDHIIRSTGYYAKLDPGVPKPRDLSEEFYKQPALEAGGFKSAHEITRGKSAKIAILDTGIDPTHPIFAHTNWGDHFSLIGRMGQPWKAKASIVDWGAHGTLITSVATVFAPEAEITVYKFSDGNTQNDPAYQYMIQCFIAAAMYKAIHDGNDIISISASGATIETEYLKEAVDYAHRMNRVVISGNPYTKWYSIGWSTNYPAQYETVISVTAAEKKEDGSYGYWDICAPYFGTDLAAASDIFGGFPTFFEEEDKYIPSISAAIPTVAALAAMTVSVCPRTGDEAPGEYTDLIMNLILDNASPEKVGFSGFSEECGHGLMDAEKTIEAALRLKESSK